MPGVVPGPGGGPDDLASWRNWAAFFTLGTINNFAYVVILCGAANLADSFDDGALTGGLA